jgi:hypothetical protein
LQWHDTKLNALHKVAVALLQWQDTKLHARLASLLQWQVLKLLHERVYQSAFRISIFNFGAVICFAYIKRHIAPLFY